jgi:hypothetical protein
LFAAETYFGPVVFPTARDAGWGGTHAALPDGPYALFTNPAALRAVDAENQFSTLGITITNPDDVFSLLGLINDMDADKAAEIAADSGGKLPLGFALTGPVAFGGVNGQRTYTSCAFADFEREYAEQRRQLVEMAGVMVKGRSCIQAAFDRTEQWVRAERIA